MTDIQRQMLRRFGSFARSLQFFTATRTSMADVVMAQSVAQTHLDSLVAQGLIYQKGDAYRITEAGRNLLDMDGKPSADYSRVNNRTQSTHYEPKPWVVASGDEAMAFSLIKSRGPI